MIYVGEAGHGRHIVSFSEAELKLFYNWLLEIKGAQCFPGAGDVFPRFATKRSKKVFPGLEAHE